MRRLCPSMVGGHLRSFLPDGRVGTARRCIRSGRGANVALIAPQPVAPLSPASASPIRQQGERGIRPFPACRRLGWRPFWLTRLQRQTTPRWPVYRLAILLPRWLTRVSVQWRPARHELPWRKFADPSRFLREFERRVENTQKTTDRLPVWLWVEETSS